MDENTPLFVSTFDEESRRHVVVEADATSIWVYLTVVDAFDIASACLLCTLIPPVQDEVDAQATRGGGPPPLTEDFASPLALQSGIAPGDVDINWNDSREAVMVSLRGEPWLLIPVAAGFGYSKALGHEGPYGAPWDESRFFAFFAMS